MILNPSASASHIVTAFCIFTCLYMPAIILFLLHSGLFYEIGKFTCISLICLLCGVEILKYLLSSYFADINFGSKSKIKKYYMKIKVKEVFKCMYLLSGSTAILYIVSVLFGAPVISECEETFMFSVLVTALGIFPCSLHLGADSTVSLISGSKQLSNSMADLLLKNLRLTLLGAWIGAILIPLDWERAWQTWPIPCSLGAIAGYVCSHLLMLVQSIPVPNFISKLYVK